MIYNVINLVFLGFFQKLNEGGPVFMYPNFLILLFCIGLSAYAFIKGDPTDKWRKVLSSVSLFALVWGFLGQMLGLISAFDTISSFDSGGISPNMLAGGLKIALLSPVLGMVVFLVARLGILALILKKK